MKTRSGRLLDIINSLGITQKEFSNETSINEKLLSRYVNGQNFGEKIASKVTKRYPQFSRDWLLDEQGDMFISDKSTPYNKTEKILTEPLNNPADGDSKISKLEFEEGMVVHNNKSLERLEVKIGTTKELLNIAFNGLKNNKLEPATLKELLENSLGKLDEVLTDIHNQKSRYATILKAAAESLKTGKN